MDEINACVNTFLSGIVYLTLILMEETVTWDYIVCYSRDLVRAHRMVAKIKAGSLWINTFNVNPPDVPFGGYKMSGIGRECGEAALDYYTQVKSVYVEAGDVESPF